MARRNQDFQTVRSEGGLLPLDLLRRVLDPRSGISGNTPEDYGLPAGERLNEAITQSWNRLQRHWVEFSELADRLPDGTAGTHLTNDKWSLPLLRELAFGLLPVTAGPELDGRTFPIGRFFGPVPIHLIGCGLSLDRRAAGQRGAASANPHGMVQEFLNRSGSHLWAIVSNGLSLRVLRDSQALSRQSYLEFDLKSMFSGEIYSDFVLLWLMVHATRFVPSDGDRPETCRLEQWTQEAERLGTRALGELRGGVERALAILGAGFTGHPKNEALREALRSGTLSPAGLHEQLLRVVYRLIFLFVAEDRTLDGRSLLHPPDDSEAARIARERYAEHYGTARLRRMAGSIKGSRHGDLWFQFRSLVAPLSGDPGAEAARRHLALPALGSFLWDPASTTALNDTELTNFDFLESLRHLAYTRQNKMLRPVDYHNLGAEELGGVYESLLALTPQVSGGGAHFSFAEFTGNRRKTSGSYYTPDPLVQCLLDSALDPVVEAAVGNKTGAEAEQAILDLKVCDPAVGSGHFLVGAAHRLARHVARIRAHAAGESDPSPLLYQCAVRDVIGRCLYGVDVNPMAAELCRVSLWIEALEPGKPLSFLDRHVRVGNSLLGATAELIEAGLPDVAFKPLEVDDKNTCSELRKRNKVEREYGQRDLGLVAESEEEYDSLASRGRSIDLSPDGTLEDIRQKDAQFRRMQESADYRHAQLIADAWCAAFVWLKRPGAVDALTTDTLRRVRADPHALAPAQRKETERLANRYQFFHWHLAFPEAFANDGFDCVLGNPPWENIRADPKEFFGSTSAIDHVDPQVIDHASQVAQSDSVCSYSVKRWNEYRHGISGQRHLIINCGRFPLGAHGKCNTMPLFLETFVTLTAKKARTGIIVKSVIGTDIEYQPIFRSLVKSRRLLSFFDFVNERGLFPEVHRQERFALITISPHGKAPTGAFAFQLESPIDLNNPERLLLLSTADLETVSNGSFRVPTVTDPAQLHLLITITRNSNATYLSTEAAVDNHIMLDGGKVSRAPGYCTSESVTTATAATGRHKVINQAGLGVVPVYEGKLFGNIDHRLRTFTGVPSSVRYGKTPPLPPVSEEEKMDPAYTIEPRYWISQDHVSWWLESKGWRRRWLVLHSRKSNRDNSRTFTVSIVPFCASVDVAPIILTKDSNDFRPSVMAAALGQTFVFDYLIRQRLVGFSIGKNLLREIPAFRWYTYLEECPWRTNQTLYDWLIERILELAYTAWELHEFARDCGWHGAPFRWDEGRRLLIRSEIDAAFFFLYLRPDKDGKWRQVGGDNSSGGEDPTEDHPHVSDHFASPRDGLSYMMDTFDKVCAADELRYGEYRTKRIILEIYDAMQTAAATGRPYRTVLDPPAADRSRCHPPRFDGLGLASLADGAWARPEADRTSAETAVLASVLKAIGGPAPMRTVRLVSLLAMEPGLLTSSLSSEEASLWLRLVGPEAAALDSMASRPQASASRAWSQAVRQLRGTNILIEDLAAGTWAAGSGLDTIHTDGWPDGRVDMVMRVLHRRDAEHIVRRLPASVRDWINAEAA